MSINITAGTVLNVPRGADIARDYDYKLQVTRHPAVIRKPEGQLLHVRGRRLVPAGAVGGKREIWAFLRPGQVTIIEPEAQHGE